MKIAKRAIKITLIMLCCLVVLLFIFWRAAPSLIPYEGKTLALQEFALPGEIHTGQLGPNIYYDFNIDSGVMVISGSGITYLAREYIPVGFSPQERHGSTFDVGGREHFFPKTGRIIFPHRSHRRQANTPFPR